MVLCIKQEKAMASWPSIRRIPPETFEALHEYLKSGINPRTKKSAKARLARWKKVFELEDGKLVLKTDVPQPGMVASDGTALLDSARQRTYKVIYDTSEKDELIKKYYLHPLSGGFRGVASLHEEISRSVIGISNHDVSKVLVRFASKQIQHAAGVRTLTPIVTKEVMTRLQIDLIDVSNMKRWNEGICFILTCIDCFSKFAWAFPLKNKSASVVASQLQNLFCQEGAWAAVHTDRGKEFEGGVDVLCERFGIKHVRGLPYHSSTQGQIERFNGILRALMTKYISENTKSYLGALPGLVYSYNCKKQSATKFTPFQIHRRRGETFCIDAVVNVNLRKNAEKMKRQVMRREINKNKSTETFKIGDSVRLCTAALTQYRKYGAFKVRRLKRTAQVFNYTQAIHKIVGVRLFDETEMYRVSNYDDRWFPANALLKVDLRGLIPVGTNRATASDISFGTTRGPRPPGQLNQYNQSEASKTQDELDGDVERLERQRQLRAVEEGDDDVQLPRVQPVRAAKAKAREHHAQVTQASLYAKDKEAHLKSLISKKTKIYLRGSYFDQKAPVRVIVTEKTPGATYVCVDIRTQETLTATKKQILASLTNQGRPLPMRMIELADLGRSVARATRVLVPSNVPNVGARVSHLFGKNGEWYQGKVTKKKNKTVTVLFDDGDVLTRVWNKKFWRKM